MILCYCDHRIKIWQMPFFPNANFGKWEFFTGPKSRIWKEPSVSRNMSVFVFQLKAPKLLWQDTAENCKLYIENICSEKGQFKIRAATAVIDSKFCIHFWIMICSVTKYSLESHKFMHKTKLYSFWKLLKNPFLWFSSSPSTLWFKPLWNCI